MDALVEPVHPAAAARGGDRAARVRDLFAGIAPRYELVNSVASLGLDRGWRRAVARELDLRPGEWCLDACCGTGDLSRILADAGARVIGVDFCRPMLERAEGRRGADRIALTEGDALRLPISSGSMDAACVAFGLRNLADPERGLAELARVVRPGGRVCILDFGVPPGRGIRRLHAIYTGRVLPWLGDVLSARRGTYRYLPDTIQSWMPPEQLASAMRAVGFESVRTLRLSFGIVTLHVGVVGAPSHEG